MSEFSSFIDFIASVIERNCSRVTLISNSKICSIKISIPIRCGQPIRSAMRIYQQIERFILETRKASVVKRILFGGSFITSKAEPNDFDCIVVVNSEILGTTLRPFEYNVISRTMVRRLYGGDVLVAFEGSSAFDEYVAFFGTTREDQQVGLVEVMI